MKLVGKVPVEPLDDERLTNIERNLVVQVSEMSQRPMRAPSRMLAFAGVALAVVVAGFVGWRIGRDNEPVVAPPRPDYVAVKSGAGATSDYSGGVKAFVLVKGGLMAEAAVGGQKFAYEKK